MSFNIGLSGLHASSNDLEVTGNNIANASTTGFKKSRAEFGDVYTTTLLGTGTKPIGSGVLTENVRQSFQQGNISGTGNVLDMAIDGNGFFIQSDRGNISYTRAGMYNLDKEGYVVANNKSKLQGFPANANGVISGVMGDLRIEISNQAPRLTNLVNAMYNLNAGEKVLQEQGTRVTSNGLVVGAADSGIIESTRSALSPSGQPTTGGTPARVSFATPLAPVTNPATLGPVSIDVDLNDGNGIHTINVPQIAPATTASIQEILNTIQTAIDTEIGTQQIRAAVNTAGELELQRAGYHATDAQGFIATPDAAWAAAFGADNMQGGLPGTPLFVGNTPLSADFRNVPGTQTTTRTTSTPSLNIVASNPGSYAALTANNIYTNLDFTGPGAVLNFDVAVGNGNFYSLSMDQTNFASPGSVNITDMVAEINTQLSAAANPNAPDVLAIDAGNRIEFRVQPPAVHGDSIQIAEAGSSTIALASLGFPSTNRYDAGVAPVIANNVFDMQVISASGNSSTFTITIPPANYASLNDVAAAIQSEIDSKIGATGLAGKATVRAVGGQLVFTNNRTGQGEGINITAAGGNTHALADLGFDNMMTIAGTDEVDRTNSFRINLTVPAPDIEERSGSVEITLDEEYRSVQQLAASINRQLNSQNADSYIGVQAMAVEIEPKVVPPQYQLEFRATEKGEASIISVTNLVASGPNITEADLYGILQVNPTNGALLTTGIEGVNNKYPEQKVTITNPKGEQSEVTIPARSEANEIVALFNLQPGITATAETVMTIPLSSFNSPSKGMTFTLNGQELKSTSLKDLVDEINSFRGTTLPGIKADLAANGDLVITNQVGRDLKISMQSNVPTDSVVIQGAADTGPVVLGGSATADRSAAVGGKVTFVLNEGYTMTNPDPAISGLFGALTEDEFEPYTINTFDPENQETYNHAAPMTIYDSLGNPHTMVQYFVKEPLDPTRPNEKNIWAMYVLIDGQEIGDPDPTLPFPENLEPTRYRKELYFNQDGSLDTNATGAMYITNWVPRDSQGNINGAMGPANVLDGGLPLREPPVNSNFEIKLTGTTQHYGEFDVNEQKQNGYSQGRLTGLEIDDEGIIFARFTNGQAQVLGQVAIANFRNPEGLTPLGDTAWGESFESGNPTIGSPRTANFGKIKSNALEDSNVNLSDQLVRLIIAQRNFQANAKTIETTNQITQTILNI